MARLIDADNRIAEIKKIHCDGCDNYGGVKCRACWVDDAMCLIDDATAADAVEVIRCKDCVHYDGEGCLLTYGEFEPNLMDFCSYGEMKTDG